MRISLEDAKEKLKNIWHREVRSEKVPLLESSGRVLADDIYATINQPPFRRSAMDGYAAFEKDMVLQKEYEVMAEIDAGDINDYPPLHEAVYRIMTGARLPDGAVMVIPQEMSDYGDRKAIFHALPDRSNIVPAGEDFKEGECLLEKGITIDARAISCMAATGVKEVNVEKKVNISIFSTGDELVETGKDLLPGQIYDSNQPFLIARCKELGCQVIRHDYLKDDKELIKKALLGAAGKSDFIMTTGGVSVGNKDLMETVLLEMGAEILFHGVAVKPGMPTMLGCYQGVPILCLSGNPFAAACLFELLNPFKESIITQVKLDHEVRAGRPCRKFVRGCWNGKTVRLSDNQKNGNTKSDAGCNCLVELPEGKEPINREREVNIYLL